MNISYNGQYSVADLPLIEAEVEAYIEENIAGTGYVDVYTEDERHQAAREHIEQSVWAFNTWFIEGHVKEGVTTEVITALQLLYEDGNEALLHLIDDFEDFVQDAVDVDGYGHFLSSYDGEEHEVTVEGETYYIYAN